MFVGPDGELPLPWQRGALDAALAQQRGHALLVHAAPGIGALEFALVLAQAWLCEAGIASGIVSDIASGISTGTTSGAATSRPCGRCPSCQLLRARAHPDLNLRLPEETAVALGWPVVLDEKRKPSRQIRISEIRDAVDWIVTTSGRGHAKVLVLHPAEAMNAESASALLKTLEEPPRGARLILTAADPARLLPTVVSRCQLLRLPAPTLEQATAWLAGQGVAGPAVLLAAAGGRPLDALQWHREGVTAAVWPTLPASVLAERAEAFANWPIARVVDVLQKLCHDAVRCALGGAPRFFARAVIPGGASLPALDAWQRSLQRVMRHADHPWTAALLVESLVAEGRAALTPLDTLKR